jgi:hypothetical protein
MSDGADELAGGASSGAAVGDVAASDGELDDELDDGAASGAPLQPVATARASRTVTGGRRIRRSLGAADHVLAASADLACRREHDWRDRARGVRLVRGR